MEEIIKAFNALVFIAPRKSEEIKTIVDLSLEVQKDFLKALEQKISQEKDPIEISLPCDEKELMLEKEENFPHESLVIAALNFLLVHTYRSAGKGFTPLFCFDSNGPGPGFNCLARAILLGSMIRGYGYPIKLALMVDHASIILEAPSGNYYCEIRGAQVKLMQGSLEAHESYQWYRSVPEDKTLFQHMVVHDFDKGTISAIFESLELFKLAPDPSFCFDERINQIEWLQRQEDFFPRMNDYKADHSAEFVIEIERIKEVRFLRDLHAAFDEVVVRAFESATLQKIGDGRMNAFHSRHLDAMRDSGDEILRILNYGGTFAASTLPLELQSYFMAIREGINDNESLKDYAIAMITKKLFDKYVLV